MALEQHAAEVLSGLQGGRRAFETTDWTIVVQAADAGTDEGATALEELCRVYWPPLYSFARYRGLAPADAEDLTQAFFEDLLSHGAIARADATRGRFRTFLLTSFKHFHARQVAAAGRQKRGGGKTIVSLEALQEAESQHQAEPANDESPEKCYDRKWVASLLARVLASVRDEYARVGKTALFDELKIVLWGGRGEVGYAEIGRRLGTTEGGIKLAMHRLRRRFGEQLRTEVARTVMSPKDVEDEIRYLLATVSEQPWPLTA